MSKKSELVGQFSPSSSASAYFHLFWEAVNRANFAGELLKKETDVPRPLINEIVFLQFRKICELIALGSLFLHGDIKQTQGISGDWNADLIVRKLSRLHPSFFPKSATLSFLQGSNGKTDIAIELDTAENALTQPELLTLYRKCGEVLHRGKLVGLDLRGGFKEPDLAPSLLWLKKIAALLNGHVVSRANGAGYYFFDANDAEGKPACAIVTTFGGGVHFEKINVTLAKNPEFSMSETPQRGT